MPGRPALDERVLVVGAGPVGSVLALELARHGVGSTVVDRSTAAPAFPKMDYLNGRTMELLRRLGLADEVRRGGVDTRLRSDFIWTDTLTRPPIATWHYPAPDTLAGELGEVDDGSAPLEVYQRIPGSLLENLLRRRLREHPLVDLREGWTFTDLDERPSGVVASLVARDGGARHTLHARYLAGCDGANSVVRQCRGIPMPAAGPVTSRCSVYFTSADPLLRRHGRAFVTVGAKGITLVSRDEEDTWTASFQVPTDEPFVGDPVEVMHDMLGAEFTVDEVMGVGQWQGSLAVASRYRVGPVFLAGDAAHQFYPFGGHGANTGIADAVDLGWKLAGAVHGWGGDRLLDSYEAERRPVALFNREMSADLLEVWGRFVRLAADGASRGHIGGFLDRESHQLDNLGVHFGYRYTSSPVVVHEPGPAPRWDWHRIEPTTWPGGRAPSVRLSSGTALFDRFGTGFTLVDLTGTGAGEVAVKEALGQGIPMERLAVDEAAVRAVWERDLVLVRPDQHVAWRGDTVPDDWSAVLDVVCGR
ncbi:2-polyprenyl-6-methoxyphenol hydroxylase [Actinophytocola xanthii]|uniref:2-polyprenyl-6-methoxyphenol hydroxylase n=1 Tax=Actinophytocola xanthii TaxID=1912961 RepID=A0A1Q8C5I8_9PSEU|nr:2-polyprenyl-6-methoxyphenol hydroxylase [Actinophytocola xanthii]